MTFPSVVAGDTVTVTINGIAVAYFIAPGDTAQEVIDGLILALALTAASLVVTFTGVDADEDGDDDTLLILGTDENDYSVALTVTVGGTSMVALADPSTATLRLYAVAGPEGGGSGNPAGWYQPDGAEFHLDNRNFMERFNTAGTDRMAAELIVAGVAGDNAAAGTSLTYVQHVYVGPCAMEGNS